MNIDNYDKIDQDNGDILLKKKAVDLDWKSNRGQAYYYILSSGQVSSAFHSESFIDVSRGAFKNTFQTKEQATKAAELMRRSNAYIRACLLVDPDFVPNWSDSDQLKYVIDYEHSNEWHSISVRRVANTSAAYVSSRAKADEVIKLLVKWGVK